jgi:Phage gp6-like head-tail connector protein
MSIITLSEAKAHARIDGNDEDAIAQVYLDAAEQSAAQFLNRAIYASDVGTDTTGIVMNAAIRAACLLTFGHLYANREAVGQEQKELPLGVFHLLMPYRLEMGV